MLPRLSRVLALAGVALLLGLGTPPKVPRPASGAVFYLRYCGGHPRRVLHVEAYDHGTSSQPRDVIVSRVVRRQGRSGGIYVALPEGGYQVSLYDGLCSANVTFAVLANRVRPVNAKMERYSTSPVYEDRDMYGPAGDLAGSLPNRGMSLTLAGSNQNVYSAVISGDAYYFDDMPAGQYRLELRGSNFSVDKTVSIPENFDLMRVDLPAL